MQLLLWRIRGQRANGRAPEETLWTEERLPEGGLSRRRGHSRQDRFRRGGRSVPAKETAAGAKYGDFALILH